MEDPVKKFNAEYKKCKVYTMEHVNGIKIPKNRVKFFKHDRDQGLEILMEYVQEEKCSAKPIKATSIEDYAKKKRNIKSVLMTVKKYQATIEESCQQLNQLPKVADINNDTKKLLNLKKDIDDDLKQRDKKCKSRPAIEKLLKQVENDLKVAEEYKRKLNKIPKDYFNADKEYAPAIKAILTAKPQLSADTKDFNKLLSNELEKNNLKKAVKAHDKLANAVFDEVDEAIDAAEENKPRDMEKHIQKGAKALKKLEKQTLPYAKIKKKFKNKIKESDDKKRISRSLGYIVDLLEHVQEVWEEAKVEVAKKLK